MQRIFLIESQMIKDTLRLSRDVYHHLFNVCCLKVNDSFEFVIAEKRLYLAKIVSIESDSIKIEILDQWAINPHRDQPVEIIQSLPKQDKFTEICRMCTELGVGKIQPVYTEFCEVKVLKENKFKRAISAIQSAAKQSKQTHVPILAPLLNIAHYLEQAVFKPNALKLVAYESSSQTLSNVINDIPSELIIAIGPEGGFSHADISLFKAYGFTAFSLGSHIFRTEHAAFASICYIDGYLEGF